MSQMVTWDELTPEAQRKLLGSPTGPTVDSARRADNRFAKDGSTWYDAYLLKSMRVGR